MINDEFTNLKANNDSFIKKTEFANLPDSEFSDAGEMNLHRAAYDASLMKQADKSAGESTTSTVSEASSSAIEASSVPAVSTAGTIAAGSAGVIAVASTVAVSTLGVLAGISIALHDYEVKFNRFVVCSNQVRYDLSIMDNKMSEDDYEHYFDNADYENGEESSLPFVIRIYNTDYDASQELFFFEQSGSFDNLKLGEKYNIVIKENKYGGETLYENVFTTKENSTFFKYYFDGISDFEYGTFEFNMDFVDEKDVFDRFSLDLYELEGPDKILAHFDLLETETQDISYLDSDGYPIIDVTQEYGYTFSYYEGESLIEDKGTVSFFDKYGRTSAFTSFEFDKTASYKDFTMEVQLNYIDFFHYYDDFVLTLTIHHGSDDDPTSQPYTEDREINLETTNEPQQISLMEYDVNIRDTDLTYTYVLTCNYHGSNIELAREDEPFHILDNSGATSTDPSQFNFIFDKTANFMNKTINVQLDYVDDFNYYDEFVFTLIPHNQVNENYQWTLENVNTVQTLQISEREHYLFSFDYDFTYTLDALYRGMETHLVEAEATTFKFSDNSGAVVTDPTQFNFTFDGLYDFKNQKCTVKLDYQDDLNYYDGFYLNLYDEEDLDNPYAEIPLAATNEEQTFSTEDYDINESTNFYFELTCNYKGNATTLVEKADEPFNFYDPNSKSEVYGVTFVNNEANFAKRTFYIQLDYDDDYNVFSDFSIIFYGKGREEEDDFINQETIYLSKTKEPQLIDLSGSDSDYHTYYIDFAEYDMGYNLFWERYTDIDTESDNLAGDVDGHIVAPKLTNTAKSQVNDIVSKFQVFQEMTGGYSMFMKLDYIDDYDKFSAMHVLWQGTNEGTQTHFVEAYATQEGDTYTGDWEKVSVEVESSDISSLCDGNEHTIVVTADYYDEVNDTQVVDGVIYQEQCTPVLVDAPDLEFFTASFDENVSAGDNILYVNLVFAGNPSSYADVKLVLEGQDGNTYTYEISERELYSSMSINLNDCVESNYDADVFYNTRYKVYFIYSTLSENPNDPDNPIKSEPITLLVGENIQLIYQV